MGKGLKREHTNIKKDGMNPPFLFNVISVILLLPDTRNA